MDEAQRHVVVLGASPRPDRTANLAQKRLLAGGFRVTPVNPAYGEIDGSPSAKSLSEVTGPIDTITLYLGASRSAPLVDEIVASRPRRVIFNPGAENAMLRERLSKEGVETIEACTLTMLATKRF